MRLLGRVTLHGLVVGVQVGVIIYLQGLGFERGGDLEDGCQTCLMLMTDITADGRTFARMASSRGVVLELMVESCRPTVEKPRA